MKHLIRQRAIELGFDDCRFTSALPPEGAARLHRWLARDFQAGMAWMARNAARRCDPALVLPGVRTVISLAAGHPFDEDPSIPGASPDSRGVIARYARGLDYHTVLMEPLKALGRFVRELGGPQTRCLEYVDTGPVLERELAWRAGIGFAGKHTHLISPQLGNWFFLAEILTTLDLEPDAPARNRCGRCTRCMDACPTRAIVEPFTLDARRCISYLTIEHKGAIPVELRPAMWNRVFGCDTCLEVCPWNRFAQEGRIMKSHWQSHPAPTLADWLAMDEPGFRARFAGTPVERTGRQRMRRNACVAIGNTGTPGYITALEKAVNEPDPLIQEHAAWALERLRGAG
jgi:epoxyqueuosine reductase